MKNVIILILLLLVASASLFAQDTDLSTAASDSAKIAKAITDMFNRKIDVPIDEKIFSAKVGNNMYFSSDESAFILMMVMPTSIDKAEDQMASQAKKRPGYKKLNSGSYVTSTGRKVVFENGSMKAEGKKMLMDMYGVEVNGEASIFFAGAYLAKDEDKYKGMMKSLAEAAKLAD
jgi:hypothetical protein